MMRQLKQVPSRTGPLGSGTRHPGERVGLWARRTVRSPGSSHEHARTDQEFRTPYGECIVCGAPRLIVTRTVAGTTSYRLVCTATLFTLRNGASSVAVWVTVQ